MHTHHVRPNEPGVDDLLNETRRHGQLKVDREGESYVILSEEEWRRLSAAVPSFADLLTSCPIGNDDLPPRDTPRAVREGWFD